MELGDFSGRRGLDMRICWEIRRKIFDSCACPAAVSPECTLTQKCNRGMAEVEWARCASGPILEGSAAPVRAPAEQEDLSMHSLLVAALFVGMVIAPCVVAMFTGIE